MNIENGCSPLKDGGERDRVVRHGRLQFERCRPRVGNVDNHEVGQGTQQPQPLAEVLGLGLVEVEDHRHEAEVAQFLSQPAFSEAAQQERALFPMVSMTSRIFSLWSRR
jgi:hypothetical protein